MIPKSVIVEIEKIQKHIKAKKERIDKLKRLSKLSKNADLISDYDAIIKQADDTISAVLDSKEIMEAHKEQVILRSTAMVRLMAMGLKASLCNSEAQIEQLNNAIEDDNIKIQEMQTNKKTHGGII